MDDYKPQNQTVKNPPHLMLKFLIWNVRFLISKHCNFYKMSLFLPIQVVHYKRGLPLCGCVYICLNEHVSTWMNLGEWSSHRAETLRPASGTLLHWLHHQSSCPLCRSAVGLNAGGGASWTLILETLSCSCCQSAHVDCMYRGPSLKKRSSDVSCSGCPQAQEEHSRVLG